MKNLLLCIALLTVNVAGQSGPTSFRMTVPEVRGALELDPGPAHVAQRIRPDGKEAQMRGEDRSSGLNSSAFLQQVDFVPSAHECRARWWGTTQEPPGAHRTNVRLTDFGDMARVDYDVPEFRGQAVHQHSVHVYLGGGEVCAEVHLSKLGYRPEDDTLFSSFLKTVHLFPEAPPRPSSLDLFAKGSAFYLQRKYAEAAGYYQQALDLEKQTRGLNSAWFKVLVDNLGMSYGITGSSARAKQVFDYGLTVYPNYPMFHYNLACGYGEQGEEQLALRELRIAYKDKANMIPGETFPNPLSDDSFRKFVSDKKFVDAVQAMEPAH